MLENYLISMAFTTNPFCLNRIHRIHSIITNRLTVIPHFSYNISTRTTTNTTTTTTSLTGITTAARARQSSIHFRLNLHLNIIIHPHSRSTTLTNRIVVIYPNLANRFVTFVQR
ncbi:hypothetical protein Hdeb2414_s0007g00252241 [Helianthus debilis subsp. tardiflorus]